MVFGIDDLLLGLGISGFGAAVSGGLNVFGAGQANAASAAEAAKNREWQRAMANSAHSREMDDLRAAGMNPILAAGGGAPTGSGAQGQVQAARPGDDVMNALTSARDFARMKKELSMQDSQQKLMEAQTAQALSQKKLIETNSRTAAANAEQTEAYTPTVKAQADVEKAKAGYDKKAVGYDSVMNRLGRDVGTVTNAIGTGIRNFIRPGRPSGYSEKDMLNAAKGRGVLVP